MRCSYNSILGCVQVLIVQLTSCCYFASGKWTKYCGHPVYMSVCLFVCLSARISQKPHVYISPKLLDMLSVAVALSCSSYSAICCGSASVDDVMFSHNRSVGRQNQARRYVSSSQPVPDMVVRYRERNLMSAICCCRLASDAHSSCSCCC